MIGGDLPYRRCVGVVLLNPAGRIFVGRRRDTPDAWQMPQGGIDPGEDPRAAALRELREETGTGNAEIVAELDGWLRYDLPEHLVGRVWKGRYRGQEQKWFALRFLGTDAEIDLEAAADDEFDAWRWATADEALAAIVPFKRDVYATVIGGFRHLMDPGGAMNIIGIDHINLTCPAALEEAMIGFYERVLGLTRVPKPTGQRPSGAWLQIGEQQIHLSIDDRASRESQLAAGRHVCFRVADLDAAEAALRNAGAPITPDARPIPGIRRLFTRDPAGNNLELAEHGAGA